MSAFPTKADISEWLKTPSIGRSDYMLNISQ